MRRWSCWLDPLRPFYFAAPPPSPGRSRLDFIMAGEYGQYDFYNEALMPRYYVGDPRPTLHKRQENKCEDDHHQCKSPAVPTDSASAPKRPHGAKQLGATTAGVDIGFPGTCCPNDRYCYVDPEALTARCCPLERNCDSECGSTRYFCEQTETVTPTSGSASTTVTPACCPRACSKSFYQCEDDQGGQCCPYDNVCSGTVCISTLSSTLPPLVTPVDEGCTTSQSRCDDGDGCCDVDRKCTRLSGTAVCAPADFTAPGEIVDVDDGGLTDGAKAGIGVGVAVGVSAITAAITFFFLRRRARNRARSQAAALPAARRGDNEPGDVELMTPGQGRAGVAQDYFGPGAVDGPFSGDEGISPGTRTTGVPARPGVPEDIVVPVEIDSKGVTPVGEEIKEPARREVGPYELYGSDVPELASPEPPLESARDRDRTEEEEEQESPVVGHNGAGPRR